MGSQSCKEPAGDHGVKVEGPPELVMVRNRENTEDDVDDLMNAQGAPQCLWVESPKGQRHVTGEYILAAHDIHNGHPVWVKGDTHSSGDKWLYSSNIGTWNIGGQTALERNFQCHSAYIFCAVRHRGSMPHTFQGLWWRATGHGFVEDDSITVMVAEPRKAVHTTSTSKYGKAARPRSAPGRGSPESPTANDRSIADGDIVAATCTATKVSAAADAAEAGKSAAAAAEAARAAASAAAAAVEAVKGVTEAAKAKQSGNGKGADKRGGSGGRDPRREKKGQTKDDRPKDKRKTRSRDAETPQTPWGLPNALFQVDPRALRRSLAQLQTDRRKDREVQEVELDDRTEEGQLSDRTDRRSSSRHRQHARRQDDRWEADYFDFREREAYDRAPRSDYRDRRYTSTGRHSSSSIERRHGSRSGRPILSPGGRSVNSKASSHASRYSYDEEIDAPDPPPSLEVGFLPAPSETGFATKEHVRKCIFTTRPLGMKFEASRIPLTVRSVTQGGVAEFLGVEKGMRIVALDGMDVSGLGYETVQAELESRYSKLPAKQVLL